MLRYITSDKKRKRDDESTDNSRPTSDTLAKPSKSGRSFSKSWFKTFAWLTYNEDLQMMFCQLCQKHGQKGNFTKGSQNFRKTALTDHAISKEHRDSLESEANSTKDLLINRFEKVSEEADEAVISLLRNVYFLAKEDLAIEKFEPLNDLADLKGVKITTRLYRENCAAVEFIEIISDVFSDDIVKQLRDSPAVSFVVDESTDLSTEKHLIVYLYFLVKGELQIKFSKLLRVHAADAQNITSVIVSHLRSLGLDLAHVYGMGSDGAAVMMGKRGGVACFIKDFCPHLVEMHCVAHRLALACVDVAKSVKEVSFYESTLNAIAAFFNRSPKNLSNLELWQDLLDEPHVRPTDVHRVRWLSMTRAVDNCAKTLPALVAMLTDNSETDMLASSLLQQVTTYKFQFLTAFFQDVFGTVGTVSRALQTRDLTYSDMMNTVVAFTDGLTTQYLTDKPTYGPKLRTFLDATDDSDDYQGVTLTRAYHDKTLTDRARDCVQILVDNVNDRFPDNDKYAAFDIFDPTNFPDNARDLATYGDESISRLGDFYGSRREGRAPIDKDSLEREWGIFRPLVYNNYRRMTYGKLLVKAHESNLSTQFPNWLGSWKSVVYCPYLV